MLFCLFRDASLDSQPWIRSDAEQDDNVPVAPQVTDESEDSATQKDFPEEIIVVERPHFRLKTADDSGEDDRQRTTSPYIRDRHEDKEDSQATGSRLRIGSDGTPSPPPRRGPFLRRPPKGSSERRFSYLHVFWAP